MSRSVGRWGRGCGGSVSVKCVYGGSRVKGGEVQCRKRNRQAVGMVRPV